EPDSLVRAGGDLDLARELGRRARDDARHDTREALWVARARDVVEELPELRILGGRVLVLGVELAQVVGLLLQLRVLRFRVEQPVEPVRGIAERPGDALRADLERPKDRSAGALDAVQRPAV